MPPPDRREDRREPALEPATDQSASSGPSLDELAQDPHYVAWAVVFEAETTVAVEHLALTVLGSLTDEQLWAIRWVGLLDDGWARLSAELGARGVLS